VSVGLVDGEFVINPTDEQKKTSQMAVTVASTDSRIAMIEAGANEVDDETMFKGIMAGHEANQKIIAFIKGIRDEIGKDKFTYVVRDEFGNYSEPMTVTVRVSERMCETVYRDMEEREEYNAAVAMTAMGLMNGRQMGDDLYFDPDNPVSRQEFVALAMKCAGIRIDSSLASTFFDDDDEISPSLKGYIATAQRIGLVSGDFKDGQLLFSPEEQLCRYEAAKILSSVIGVDENAEESVFATDEDIPIWARSGVAAMCSIGAFRPEDASSLSDKITRADVAEYLYRISEFLGKK
jgi:hypothetical protein